jgi:hypothetical protein
MSNADNDALDEPVEVLGVLDDRLGPHECYRHPPATATTGYPAAFL